MKKSHSVISLLLLLTLACSCSITTASTITFNFTQKGFQSFQGGAGGVITGSFTGEDKNGDGYLNILSGEISAYSVSFSGNTDIPAFTHGLGDLRYFSYAIGSPGFGHEANPNFHFSNYAYSTNGTSNYDSDDEQVWLGSYGSSPIYWTHESAYVTAVPEPNIYLLLLAGLLALTCLRNRNVPKAKWNLE